MRTLTAAAVLGIAFTSTVPASAAPTARDVALQDHRAAGHQAPEHHLQEARRALDRASDKAKKGDLQALEPIRAEFAALALAYAKLPTDGRGGDLQPGAAAGSTGSRAAAAGTAADVPPQTAAVTPPVATSTKPLVEWQQKYADVERDLKAFATGDRVLRNRVDHVRMHLQMFYAAALGKDRAGS